MVNIASSKTENIVLYSNKAYISELDSNPDIFVCKFILCDFSVNQNGVALNRDTITEWMGTIKNKPVVGKIQARYDNGEEDFTDHAVELVQKIDEDGNPYTDIIFNSDAFGTFTDVSIENIEGVDYLVATAEIWKRFEKACAIIQKRINNGELKTSWEINVIDSSQKVTGGTIIKLINFGRFLGHVLLGRFIEPAYPSSKLLNIAQKEDNDDFELTKALAEDILFSNINSKIKSTEREENKNLNMEEKNSEAENVTVNNPETEALATEEVEANTVDTPVADKPNDINAENTDENAERKNKDEPDAENSNDVISALNSTIEKLESDLAVRGKTIIALNSKIQELTAEITSLIPFKEEFEKSEQKKIEAETIVKKERLKNNVMKAMKMSLKEVESSKEIMSMIDILDETKLNDYIVSQITSKVDSEIATVQTSSTKEHSVRRESLECNAPIDYKSVMKSFLTKS